MTKVRALDVDITRDAHNQNIGKPNNLKVFGSKSTKKPKHDSQDRLKSINGR
jgi:hypothetical protein